MKSVANLSCIQFTKCSSSLWPMKYIGFLPTDFNRFAAVQGDAAILFDNYSTGLVQSFQV